MRQVGRQSMVAWTQDLSALTRLDKRLIDSMQTGTNTMQ
jgi:hypothetical protein